MTLRGLCRIATAVVVISASVLIESACAAPRGRMYVVVAPPPPPMVEARIVAPGPGYIWVAGYHRWDGRAYVWMPGTWVRPPHSRARWVPAHWERERRGWYFVEGHWR
jgi:YXWGXW repeat-containing protein